MTIHHSTLPHGRGDGPITAGSHGSTMTSSPRAWGWSVHMVVILSTPFLFPTGVGMVRYRPCHSVGFCPLPHGRGDGPSIHHRMPPAMVSSPRAWGWSDAE